MPSASGLRVGRAGRRGLLVAALITLGVVVGAMAQGESASASGQSGLLQINAGTGHVARAIPIGGAPTAVAFGGGRLWATAQGKRGIWTVNPSTGATTLIPHVTASAPLSIAASQRRAYVMDNNAIKLVSAGADRVVSSVPMARVDGSPTLVASGPSGVWGIAGDTVFKVRTVNSHLSVPARLQVHIPARENDAQVRSRLTAMAVGPHSVFVIGDVGDRRLWRIDPTRPRVTATISLPFTPVDVAVGLGGVWVTDQISDRLFKINPSNGKIVKVISVGREPMGVAVGAGSVWVTNAIDGTVSKIDPATGAVAATTPVAGSPNRVAFGAGSVWVAANRFAPAPSGNAIRIGVVVDCGAFSFQRQAVLAGAELPLIQRGAVLAHANPSAGLTGASVAGKPVKLLTACSTYGDRSKTISALSTLVERDHADIVIGSEIEGEGNVVREYARVHPGVTFMATSFDQSTTLRRTVPNLYHFEPDAVMYNAGLGAYARRTLHWKTAATVTTADYSGWASVTGFDAEFCSLGGHVPQRDRIWVDTAHGETVGHRLPKGVDGVFLPGGVGGTGTFLPKWAKAHPPLARHLEVGWAALAPVPQLLGVVGASSDPFQPTPAWNRYLAAFAKAFPHTHDPGFANQPDYDAMEPVLEALQQVNGDVSGNEQRLQNALASLRYHSPEGVITLDKRHQAVVPIYLGQVRRKPDKTIYIKQIATMKNVEQTFNGYFSPTKPAPSKTAPACVAGNPPPWAR
jgi:branched-chain amino acid transport system substrate-binding protein